MEAARSRPSEPEKYLREGLSLKMLDTVAARKSDNQAAREMQEAKERLFRKSGFANGGPP